MLSFTQRDEELERRILAMVPSGPRTVIFRQVEHSHAELKAAARSAFEWWAQATDGRQLLFAGIAEDLNSIRLGVLPTDMELANANHSSISKALGVRVRFEPADYPTIEAQTCTSRTNCFDPLESGVLIRRGGWHTFQYTCTMGFHITTSLGDEQFLTSGHCRSEDPGALHSWYHSANFGLIGTEGDSAYDGDGYDAMRVHMPDIQASNDVYAHWLPITGSWTPTQNGAVCASLGNTGGIDCGTIGDDWITYFQPECFCLLDGGDHNGITTKGGDSGSPIYSQGSSWLTAIGLHANAFGYFARVADVLIHWNSEVVDW